MSLKLWWDPLSPPARFVKYILEFLGEDYDSNLSLVFKDTQTEEFKRDVNPLGKVPVVEHDGDKIYESASIIKYLMDTFRRKQKLYPRNDFIERAKIDFWLDWNNTSARTSFSNAFVAIALGPKLFNMPKVKKNKKKELMEKLYECMNFIDTKLEDNSYLTGENFTICDVQIYNEVFEVQSILELDLSEYEALTSWMERMQKDSIIKDLDKQFLKRLSE